MGKASYQIAWILTVVALFGCAIMVTNKATLKVDASELEKVKAIVHSVFMEFGARYYGLADGRSQYLLFKHPTSDGLGGADYTVAYKAIAEQIVINISDKTGTGADLESSKQYLAKILSLAQEKFKDAGLRVKIETGSFWFPAPFI